MARQSRRKRKANTKTRISIPKLVYRFTKRSADVVVAVLAAIALSPLLILVAVAIRMESDGRILFKQRRVGQMGDCFDMWKFRSMYEGADAIKVEERGDNEMDCGVTFKMKKDPRVTRVGRIIRKLSIDELPQLWNVIKGDLTLVGPRPALPSEVKAYTLYQQQRLTVKPGLTCIWQVSGRSTVPFLRQVEMDLKYIRKRTTLHDLVLLLKTIPAVLKGKGAF